MYISAETTKQSFIFIYIFKRYCLGCVASPMGVNHVEYKRWGGGVYRGEGERSIKGEDGWVGGV